MSGSSLASKSLHMYVISLCLCALYSNAGCTFSPMFFLRTRMALSVYKDLMPIVPFLVVNGIIEQV